MWWERIKNKVKIFLSILAVYISVTGLITFSLFIAEESIQACMFGTWQAIEAKDWETVKFGCDRLKEGSRLLTNMNRYFGWIQPFSFLAYRSYGEATEAYIQGLEARIFANAPELYDSKTLTFAFTPQSVAKKGDLFSHTNGKITFISSIEHPKGARKRVTGTVSVDCERIIIHEAPQN